MLLHQVTNSNEVRLDSVLIMDQLPGHNDVPKAAGQRVFLQNQPGTDCVASSGPDLTMTCHIRITSTIITIQRKISRFPACHGDTPLSLDGKNDGQIL